MTHRESICLAGCWNETETNISQWASSFGSDPLPQLPHGYQMSLCASVIWMYMWTCWWSLWVCGACVVHHCNSIELHYAPLTCIVHHWPVMCTVVHKGDAYWLKMGILQTLGSKANRPKVLNFPGTVNVMITPLCQHALSILMYWYATSIWKPRPVRSTENNPRVSQLWVID